VTPPVLVVAFNRPGVTARVLDRIRAANPPALYAAVDGPRPGRGDDRAIGEVHELFAAEHWDCPVHHRFQTSNAGVRTHLPGAITWFFEHEPEGIIIEDDCLPDPSFFPFCEQVLAAHRDDPDVLHVGANNFQPPDRHRSASYYFSAYSHVWGWASWRDAWAHNDLELAGVSEAEFATCLRRLFRRRRDRRYWGLMFRYARSGKVETWDYSWMFTQWARGARAVTPTTNLVSNLGFGVASTHTHDPADRWAALPTEPVPLPLQHPGSDELDRTADEWTSDVFYGIRAKARSGFVKVRLALVLPVSWRRQLKRWRARLTSRKNSGG
jgi:hypothetical protein